MFIIYYKKNILFWFSKNLKITLDIILGQDLLILKKNFNLEM